MTMTIFEKNEQIRIARELDAAFEADPQFRGLIEEQLPPAYFSPPGYAWRRPEQYRDAWHAQPFARALAHTHTRE